jgi:hypothetical protein
VQPFHASLLNPDRRATLLAGEKVDRSTYTKSDASGLPVVSNVAGKSLLLRVGRHEELTYDTRNWPPRDVIQGGFMREERLSSGPLRFKDPRREAMLEPEEVSAILRLNELGWGAKRISRELGISRNTAKD